MALSSRGPGQIAELTRERGSAVSDGGDKRRV